LTTEHHASSSAGDPRYVRAPVIDRTVGSGVARGLLGIFALGRKSRVFKCNLDHAKRSLYRAVNAIFGRIGRIASEEVIIQLIRSKCIPVLTYDLEVCPLTKSDLKSLDFPVNRFFFMKLFKTSNIQMVNDCQVYFGFDKCHY